MIQIIKRSRTVQVFYLAWAIGVAGLLLRLAAGLGTAGGLLIVAGVVLARSPDDALVVAAREGRLPFTFGKNDRRSKARLGTTSGRMFTAAVLVLIGIGWIFSAVLAGAQGFD